MHLSVFLGCMDRSYATIRVVLKMRLVHVRICSATLIFRGQKVAVSGLQSCTDQNKAFYGGKDVEASGSSHMQHSAITLHRMQPAVERIDRQNAEDHRLAE